jgi:hypothetical protein
MKKTPSYLQVDIASHQARIIELQQPTRLRKGSRLWPTDKDRVHLIKMYEDLIATMQTKA